MKKLILLDKSMLKKFANQDKADGVKKAWYYHVASHNLISALDTEADVKSYAQKTFVGAYGSSFKQEVLMTIDLDKYDCKELKVKKGRVIIFKCSHEANCGAEIATLYGRLCGTHEYSLVELLYDDNASYSDLNKFNITN